MDYENEELAPKSTFCATLTPQQKNKLHKSLMIFILFIFIAIFVYICVRAIQYNPSVEDYVPDIIIPSMDFTVLNIAETSLSVKWDLVMRIPPDLPGYYTCLKGYFQTFILYKGVTIAHSSFERYNLMLNWAQLLNISSIASIGDLDGKVVKDIMEDVYFNYII
ncbi:LOW QUALITY PROTEIN: uncharacterized protein LOC17896427 [Capsella rubella]|uniref:LOW QUALITY PROTEIN: uncharacterized protein LOC17896427 n=1 Tax=Capsella rubella TaxID=81985 RepID=UPI000CD4AA93|nr:LOW QUALITY PROTEIN: uncharacterized protein LOC17896427 [Capsella rubella]